MHCCCNNGQGQDMCSFSLKKVVLLISTRCRCCCPHILHNYCLQSRLLGPLSAFYAYTRIIFRALTCLHP